MYTKSDTKNAHKNTLIIILIVYNFNVGGIYFFYIYVCVCIALPSIEYGVCDKRTIDTNTTQILFYIKTCTILMGETMHMNINYVWLGDIEDRKGTTFVAMFWGSWIVALSHRHNINNLIHSCLSFFILFTLLSFQFKNIIISSTLNI